MPLGRLQTAANNQVPDLILRLISRMMNFKTEQISTVPRRETGICTANSGAGVRGAPTQVVGLTHVADVTAPERRGWALQSLLSSLSCPGGRECHGCAR